MKERFKRYLEREFKRIAPTKEAMEYREEVFRNLLDKSQELKIKGIENEEMIYEMCIDDLGDFHITLQDFENKRIEIKETARKAGITIIFAITAILFISIGYLIISFLTSAWSQTWLIFVLAILAFIVVLSSIRIPKLLKENKFIIIKLYVLASIAMVTVSIYLCMLMLFTVPLVWLAFLVMPMIMTLALTVISLIGDSKMKYIDLAAFIMTTTSLLYVILGILDVIEWSWGWLLPVFGVFLVLLVFAIQIIIYKKNKISSNDDIDKISNENEKFYTQWKE
ncbi:MAG: hypothetical protein WCR54_00480 [Clostridia bacterium]